MASKNSKRSNSAYTLDDLKQPKWNLRYLKPSYKRTNKIILRGNPNHATVAFMEVLKNSKYKFHYIYKFGYDYNHKRSSFIIYAKALHKLKFESESGTFLRKFARLYSIPFFLAYFPNRGFSYTFQKICSVLLKMFIFYTPRWLLKCGKYCELWKVYS